MIEEVLRWVYAAELNPAVAVTAVACLCGLIIASMSLLKFK